MFYIQVRDLHKSYVVPAVHGTDRVDVLRGFDLDVRRGEFLTIFGPNACGKSTLLYLVGGLLPPDSGQILIDGRPPDQAKRGFIFQNYGESLFPWRKVIDNISFPLELQGMGKAKRHALAVDFLGKLGVQLPLSSYPYQLSGGQQQLVAIVRALVYEPDVILMDEPFASLDHQARASMQLVLMDLWRKTGTTILFVSHEIDEAIFLAQRFVLLSRRPATVVDSFEVGLPQPRTLDLQESQEFFSLRTRAVREFKKSLVP